MKRTLRQRLSLLACAAGTVLLLTTSAMAQAQQTFNVGDRVEADPMLLDKWRPATVVKVYTVGGALNGYEIQFDPDENRKPEQYTVGTTVARGIRPASEAAKP